MAILTTSYMGLSLRNPIIAASSGLTNRVNNIVDLEANGAVSYTHLTLPTKRIV